MKKLDSKRIENILALTPMQEGMLFHYLQEPQSELYFEQLSLQISGKIDLQHFEKAWNAVIESNEMLRAEFRWEKLEKPAQIILGEYKCSPIFYDLTAKISSQKQSALAEIKKKDRHNTFDLRQVPFRIILCKLADNLYEMIISNHHILYDGWSNGIILKEFFSAYHELCRGSQLSNLPIKTSFKEFVKWIQNLDKNKQSEFWKDYLIGFETPTHLPIKKKINENAGIKKYPLILVGDLKEKLNNYVKNNRVTLASIFYSAWAILLQKYCSSEDVIFGTTVSGRSADIKGIEEIVGLFINTIPLRTKTHPAETIGDMVFQTDQVLREREEFENTPLVDVSSYVPMEKGNPLFDTIIVIENYPLDNRLLPENSLLSINSYSLFETTNYDLTVNILLFNEIEINFIYVQGLFDKEAIENLAAHFKRIIQHIIQYPETKLSELEIISAAEKNRILNDFNNTGADYPRDKTIQQLFAEQVGKTPNHIALVGAKRHLRVCPNMMLTYYQLNGQSDQLAGLLIEKGVLPDNIVGIIMERSIEMVIGIFGILKAGGAYLPIDPTYPQERIDYMLKDSQAKIIVNNEFLMNSPQAILQHSAFSIQHSKLIYIIYTSGSTGTPKGVMINHNSVVNLLFAMQCEHPFTPEDTYLLKTSYIFDVSVTELFGWYMGGGKLAILEKDGHKDPRAIVDAIERNKVTHINFVPSMFNAFVEYLARINVCRLASLKYIFLAGEVILPEIVDLFLALNTSINLENIYGPTESTVYAAKYSLSAWNGTGSIPIGKPLPNIALYIVNKYNYLQPIGVAGELYISGIGLARGYLNRPELTCEKFKFNRSSRSYKTYILYCTGDLSRWLPDGNIEFLGRIDQQVKIRGFRIEPEEIENRLLKHAEIKEAVVLAKEDAAGDKYLAAYFVSELEIPGIELKEYLARDLPVYMIPSYFIRLERIPLTLNGKIDKKSFPQPLNIAENTFVGAIEYIAPRNDIEKKLAGLWSHLLGVRQETMGIDADFFRMGGHSIKITRLASLISRDLNVNIQLTQLFKLSTIRLQAQYLWEMIQQQQKKELSSIPLLPLLPPIQHAPEQEYYDLSYAQRRLWIICQFEEDSIVYNEVGGLAIKGKFNPEALDRTIQALAQRHEILRTVFVIVDGEPKQKILSEVKLKLQQEDLRYLKGLNGGLKGDRQKNEASLIIKNTANKAFNLEKGPLAVFKLLHLEEDSYFLIVNIHHIINDGWSIGIIKKELTILYDFFNKNRSITSLTFSNEDILRLPLPPLKFQYKDYTLWHNRLITGDYLTKYKHYWLEKFKDKPTGIELPLDYPRGAIQTFNGGRVYFSIKEPETKKLHELEASSNGKNATLFMKLMALMDILFFKYSGENDVILGSPIAGRKQPELHPMIGFLVNTLVYRIKVEPKENFRELLDRVKEETLACYENQDFPFDILVENLGLARDLSRSPLFNVMMAFGDADTRGEDIHFEWTDVQFQEQIEGFNPSVFDLVFFLNEKEKGKYLDCEIMYNSDLFKRKTIEHMAANFLTLMISVLENVNKPISELEYIEKNEFATIVYQFNHNKKEFQPMTIQELVEEQVKKSLDSIAVVSSRGWAITYDELNKRANQLTHYLREKYNMGPGSIVGICIERSLEMIIAILGVIKSGAAYLSFDPNYPKDRVRHMIEDSRAGLVIIDQSRPDLFDVNEANESQTLLNIHQHWPLIGKELFQDPKIENELSDAVYVIYTSGSTGVPNGAMLSHALLSNLLQWQKANTGIDSSLRCLQFTSINFCVSFQEIFTTLSSGGQVHLIGDIERQDSEYLMEFLTRRRIGNLYLPFSYLNFLFNLAGERTTANNKTYLQHIITAGEQLKITGGLKKFLQQNPGIKLHNHYGSSEMHVVTSFTLDAQTASRMPVPPAGKPIANTRIYILDENEKPVPIGVWGELFVDGSHQVLGYIHNPVLTDKKLVWNPVLSPLSGHRLYRSGDVGRWLEDGNIELKGRKDFQVKIRGFRVEPNEIESKILGLAKVKDCVVIVKENNAETSVEKILVAYVVAHDLDAAEIKRHLGGYLPQYMIPKFMMLDHLPLMPNGKVDREKLPEFSADNTSDEKDTEISSITPAGAMRQKVQFENEIEEELAGIWSELLGIEKGAIGREDNFFELGGHSLKATTMMTRIHKEFNVRVKLIDIFKAPTIQDIAVLIGQFSKEHMEHFVGIDSAEKKEFYMISSAQKRMYILQQIDETNTGYNMSRVMELEGDVDIEKLEHAVEKLVERHEAFRTSFHMVGSQAVQIIHDHVLFEINKSFAELFQKRPLLNFIQPFDLSKVPLLRLGLVKSAEKRYLLMVDMHHIISDGVSIEIMIKDFMSLYNSDELAPVRVQYKDYAEWQQREKSSENLLKQKEYWKKEFEGEIPVLDLPIDYGRPPVQSFEGDCLNFEIGSEIAGTLKSLALESGLTLYMMLFSIYSIFLAGVSGREDIVIGTPAAGRRHADLEKIIGMFVNTLALRSFPLGEKKFSDFLDEIKKRTLGAFENQDYQYEDLLEELKIIRDAGRNPLFDTLFALQNAGLGVIEIPGLKIKPYEQETLAAKFDLALIVEEREDEKLLFKLEYCSKLFKKETAERFIDYFKNIVKGIIENKERKISDFKIITEEEKRKILYEFNDTGKEYPRDKTIPQLFEAQVEKTPNGIALVGPHVCPDQNNRNILLTYNELNKKSDYLGGLLIHKGVLADDIVGIMMERSIDLIIGILGILKVGSAYLPIDPEYPEERIDYILRDSVVKLLLRKLEGESSSYPFTLPSCLLKSSNLAYIIYTSGSTGRPKGVMIEHRALVNLCHWHNHYYELTDKDHISQYATIGFDASIWEIFPALTAGAALHFIAADIRLDMEALNNFFEKHNITVCFLPTSACLPFMNIEKGNQSLRLVLTGGDKLQGYIKKNYRLYNNYGPTENTIVTTVYPLGSNAGNLGNIPIGTPIANTQVYILGKDNFQLQPVGTAGELCISGHGLSRGYLNNPELTCEKFKFNRSYRSYRTYIFYKTGDLARWLMDGNIEFLGRIDNQVKIRGFRIELGEIENRLAGYPGITGCTVTTRERLTGEKYICAYYTAATTLEIAGVREYLTCQLPDYMIPAYFIQLENIPITANGKIDTKKLPMPETKISKHFVAPKNNEEKLIASLWKETLELENIGIDDNFFELGGNSLDIVKVHHRLREQLTKDIPLVAMFRYSTVRGLAAYLDQNTIDITLNKKNIFEAMDKGKNKLKKRIEKRKMANVK